MKGAPTVSEPLDLAGFFRAQAIPLWGVADCRDQPAPAAALPPPALTGLTRAVVFAFPLSRAVLGTLDSGPNLLYLHHYRQVNYHLDRVGLLLGALLEQQRFAALPVPASQVIDWQTPRGHLCHRRLARAAGLGWLGRNNLLVTPGFGSRVRLAAVLTDCPLAPARPREDGCGSCTACRGRCPAGAIGADPAGFDRVVCAAFIRKTCRGRGIGQDICGLCLCGRPPGRFP